ncbi:DUF4365 domain-containing protein [Streptomyces sp. NPDC059371]|uniref:DUF4365 domain-containing protein n=1 Tax=Streptomyces sp. NPDC059371 TaxID=3346812 RepID=UPI0036C1D5B5
MGDELGPDVGEDEDEDDALLTAPTELLDGNLPKNARQEHFSLAYLRMVTYAAGCSIKVHETDYEGLDITVTSAADHEFYYGPEFNVQMKCTTRTELLRKKHMAWPMKPDTYKKLIQPKRMAPSYLMVLLVPGEPESWLEIDESQLLTRSRMYWQEAALLPPFKEGNETQTVQLPRSNLFDVSQLLGIMKKIGEGGGVW